MSRQLKPQRVEMYRHRRRGVSFELMLDRNTHEFFFEFQKTRYTKPSLAELQKVAHKVAEEATSLIWLPMVTVTRLEPFADRGEEFIGFKFERSWIAQKHDRSWLELRWDDDGWDPNKDTGERWDRGESWAHDFYAASHAKGEFKLPWYGDGTYLPYTEELWAGLEMIQGKIREMKRALDHLLRTPEGLARVAAAGGPLGLPPGPLLLEEKEEPCQTTKPSRPRRK